MAPGQDTTRRRVRLSFANCMKLTDEDGRDEGVVKVELGGSNLQTFKLVSLLCTTGRGSPPQCFLLMCSCFDVWMMVELRPAQLQLHLQIGKIFFSLLPFFTGTPEEVVMLPWYSKGSSGVV